MKGVLNLDMELGGEFIGEPTLRGSQNPGLNRVDEGAMAREPNLVVGPETVIVKTNGLRERVEAPPVGVAG